MEKIYISAGELLADSFRLGARILKSGYHPDFVLGVWRGGAPVAIAIHEYFSILGVATELVAIKASSYAGIDQRTRTVRVTGLSQLLDLVSPDHSLLIVDDVFDTGLTVAEILAQLRQQTGERCPNQIRVACPWYKHTRNRTQCRPDYHLHETSSWLVFPHELDGLSRAEVRCKPDLGGVLDELEL